jgi:hypothetical protein
MDSDGQKVGEERVKERLVQRLDRLGLARPSGVAASAWDAARAEIAARLAYMSADALDGLAEEVEAQAGAQARGGVARWPAPVHLLARAAVIEPPPVADSPLIRRLFAHPDGQRAVLAGWGPELLAWVRKARQWPGQYQLSQIEAEAAPSVRRLADLELRGARGEDLRADEADWVARRRAAMARCLDLSRSGVVA